MGQQERARITRERVISGAAQAFYTLGYAGAALSDITEAASTSKGAIYFHFESKQDIARAVVAQMLATGLTSGERVVAAASSAIEGTMGLTIDYARLIAADPVFRAGVRLTTEVMNFDPPLSAPFVEWVEPIERLARAAQAEGDYREDLDVAVLARFVIPAFTGVQQVSGALTGHADLLQRVREMWIILLPGLVPPHRLDTVLATLDRLIPAAPGTPAALAV
jgi:AcrR family transcriptional regulator